MKRILILGGTSDAIALAAAIQIPQVEVVSSLAGRTQNPSTPDGIVRVGGFGGAMGLAAYLREQAIDLLVDATHPFAAQISWNAATAAKETEIPHLMCVRPAWKKVTGDRWLEVESHAAAAQLLPGLAQRIFLTIGRQELAVFAPLTDLWFLMRMIDPPGVEALIPPGEILLERGPFILENERKLLEKYHIEAIVSKNSGGDATYAKIIAARELGIPMVMIQRPVMPEGAIASNMEQALAWIVSAL